MALLRVSLMKLVRRPATWIALRTSVVRKEVFPGGTVST
jgi:hypothetical protein